MTSPKHYFTFNFVDKNGWPVGWNHEVASTEEEAIELAHARWDGEMENTFVDESSFRKQTDEQMESLMRLTL